MKPSTSLKWSWCSWVSTMAESWSGSVKLWRLPKVPGPASIHTEVPDAHDRTRYPLAAPPACWWLPSQPRMVSEITRSPRRRVGAPVAMGAARVGDGGRVGPDEALHRAELLSEEPAPHGPEPFHVTRGVHPQRAGFVRAACHAESARLGVAQDGSHLEGGLVRRRHEDHVPTHHIGDGAGQERVVRTPEQQGVDPGVTHRRQEALGQHGHLIR